MLRHGVAVSLGWGRSAAGGARPHEGCTPPRSPRACVPGAPGQRAPPHRDLLPRRGHHGGHHSVPGVPQSVFGNDLFIVRHLDSKKLLMFKECIVSKMLIIYEIIFFVIVCFNLLAMCIFFRLSFTYRAQICIHCYRESIQ